MSSVSEASIAAGAAKTPRMANLESGQQHFTKAAVDAPGDVTSVASKSKDKKSKTTSVSSVKTSSSYAAAPSPESASALPPKRTVRRSNSRRSSSGSSHRSSTQQRPPTTPLKNHNTNNSVAGSVDTTMTLSATGLMQTSSVVAVAATSSPSPTKPASLQTAPASPNLPRRRSSSEATMQTNTRQQKHHDRNESWTFHEKELDSLLVCQPNDNDHQDVPSVDCLDVSMQVLQNSMNQAKQAAACQPVRRSEDYEQDEEEEEYYDDDQETQLSMDHGNHHKRKSSSSNHHDENMNNTSKTDAAAQPSSSQSSWWMNIVQRLQNSHDEERYKWKDDLRVAKIQGKHLKSELRESIEQRIQWLEERLVWEDEQRHKPNGQDHTNGIDTVASVSSGTTMVTASTMGNYTNYTVDERNALHQTAAGAATNGVEVSFDTAQAIQRLGELEQRVQDFEYEKEQWERALSHAELELQKDKKLSGAMQKQLQKLAQEVDSYSDTNHKHCKEKQKVQKQLLQLLEQQLNTERCEWLQEKEILDHTIQQLNLDISQVNVDMRNTSDKLQRVAREEKKLRAQREAWLYDKDIMQISIQQLLTDKSSYKTTAESLRKELKAVKQRLGEANETEDTLTDAPAVESVYSELDESLDRAIAERDLYKQEAENLRKTLEMERARWQEAEAAADDTVNEIRHEFGSIVEELKAELKKTSSTTATQTCEGISHQANRAQTPDDEQRLKEIRDEYTAVIDDLEGRLLNQQADDSRQLEECLAKNKELNVKLRSLERQHADDRGEWKLRLEAALADGRKLREIKSSLEGEVRDLKNAHHEKETTDSPIHAQLQDALADSERLQLELAALRQSYEAEVQAIFDDAKARQSPTSKGEWKLQLEASLAETRRVRRLKEDLETEIRELKDSFAQEKNELLECGNINAEELRRDLAAAHETIQSDEEVKHTMRAELDLLQNMESEMRHQKDLYSDLKEKYDREAQEWSAQLDESRLHEEVEVEDLQNKLAKETKDLQKAVRREQKIIQELKTQHAVELKSLKAKLDEPDLKSIAKVKQLSEELHQVKGEALQTKLNLASEIQRITLEKDFRIRELELAIGQTKERLQSSDQLSASVTQLIDGLHTDMLAIKASVESTATKTLSVDNSSIAELKTSVEEMQNGLNDTIAELTLEADAIMEIKSLVEAVAQDMKSSAETSRILEQQEGLLSEVREMRAQLTGLVESGGVSGPKDVMYQDAMTELQRKVSQVAELQAELEHAKIELERKSTQLIHAEAEILTLNDQADAYSDEIMRMQALNADHEKNLRLAERKIQALLNAPDMPRGLDDFDECNTKSYDDSTPLLEEALALAQGLQELVQGRDSDQNVLEMLQSMSDLMDHHELADDGSSQASLQDGSVMDVSDAVKGRPHSPQRRQQVEQRDQRYMHQEREEPPPDPIQTPLQPNRHRDGSVSLQLVVEQLYGRCQMLERERTEMMEVTLSLLESARRANTAEMDAALATVRRRTMDDVIRVRKQTIMEQERLYQRLCEDGGDHPQPDVAVTIVPPLERSRPVAYAE